MDWTRILADASIPEPPGRSAVLEQLRQRREDQRLMEVARDLEKAEQRRQKLAKGAGHRRV